MFLSLLHFQSFLRGKHALVHTDNRVMVLYINHLGGTRSRSALQVARKLLVWGSDQKSFMWQGVTRRSDSTPGSGADDMEDLWDCSSRRVRGQSKRLTALVGYP